MNQESSPIEGFVKIIRQEQFDTMERGFKVEERKILFVIALFGIGGYGYNENIMKNFGYLYYLIPLLAIAFDVLIARLNFSVRRIGVFLRGHSTSLDGDWESFVHKYRDSYFRFGTDIFTIITFLASIWLVFKYIHKENFSNINYFEYFWYLLLIVIGFCARFHNFKRIQKLESDIYARNVMIIK